MSSQPRMPWCGHTFRKVEIGNTWTQGKDQRRHCHRDLSDGPDNWVVDGAAHDVPGQAGALEQQVNNI